MNNREDQDQVEKVQNWVEEVRSMGELQMQITRVVGGCGLKSLRDWFTRYN